MRKGKHGQWAGAGGQLGDDVADSPALAAPPDPRAALMGALRAVGLDEAAAAVFGDAAMVVGALSQGRRVRDLELGTASSSALAAQQAGTRPRDRAAPGSMEAHLHQADVALTAVEALAACSARLDAAVVVATGEQVTATGAALLAQRDVTDPGELSRTARERWRARAKSRTRQELAPATGWTQRECAHLVAVACAPLAFSAPVVDQMARAVLPWRLARALWRACESLDATDAAQVATVMCADDPATCVPERLGPDGTVLVGPWEHRAFYAALTREVAKVTQADDADPEAAQLDRARREAAFAGRQVLASVDEDGTGSLTLITSSLWVAGIKDRLNRAARAARGAGDERSLRQLESDIARTLLAHATIGLADLPRPVADGEDGPGGVPEDLERSGWSPQLVQTLSGLPPAVLQVVVPLMGVHDPAAAATLPVAGRVAVRPDRNAPTGAECAGHTGSVGCPACLPGVRAGRPHPSGERRPDDLGSDVPGMRRLWVGEVLGDLSMVLPPAQVRALASAPGTTLTRLLVDPADGRCLERSIATYRPDAAMRAQLLAADVTCRAPACHHPGRSCHVDHVVEHGSPGGVTSEANAQLVHAGHHESKTAKDWDAKLSANRDVRWTTLLGRVYRTRAWDYRRYVTLVVGAMEAVRSAPAGERAVELDRQIYLALAHRELGERLNVGDDDLDPDICRFEGWPAVRLTHRDPATGERVPGPSPAAVTDTIVARATSNPVAAHPHAVIEPGAHPAPRPPTAADLDGRTSTRDRTRRRTPDRSSVQRAWTLADEEGIVPF